VSRLERHKARREGKVTGIGKEEEVKVEKDIELTQKFSNINPIVRPDEDAEIKRKKRYNNPVVNKSLNIEEIKEKASGNKKELFDIEEAFNRLQKTHRVPDQDTQLEIMSELFSDNSVEYNNSIKFEKDYETNRIMISEEELMKLLDEREKAHNKELEKKRKKEKKQNIKTVKEEVDEVEYTAPYVKEDFEVKEFNEIKSDDSIKNRIEKADDEFDKFAEKEGKASWLLIAIFIVLLLILGFLVYSFLR